MRLSRLSPLLVLASRAAALPQQAPKAMQFKDNDVDILGGDFGLPDLPLLIEIWNTISKLSSGREADANGTPNTAGSGTANLEDDPTGQALRNYFGGSLMQAISGSDSKDFTTVVCSITAHKADKLPAQLVKYLGTATARPQDRCERDTSGGSGPYKANLTTDRTLPIRTLYAPVKPPPASVRMPVFLWAGPVASGSSYANFLTEIASHGYLVIVTGPTNGISGSTAVSDIAMNIDWVTKNAAAKKYGNVDTSRIAVAGHSWGGLEAMSGSYRDPRVSLTLVFDSGTVDDGKRQKIKELKNTVAFILGDSKDLAYKNVSGFDRGEAGLMCVGQEGLRDGAGAGPRAVRLAQGCRAPGHLLRARRRTHGQGRGRPDGLEAARRRVQAGAVLRLRQCDGQGRPGHGRRRVDARFQEWVLLAALTLVRYRTR
jgi:pimeloyl-ACP methyl ester carboxylesterase